MRKLGAFLLAILLTFCLCACQTSPDVYVPTGNGLTGDNPDRPGPSTGGSREIDLPYYPLRSMNPYECTDYVNRAVLGLLYQSLFAVDESGAVSPVLCKNYKVSRDMKTYTFYPESATFSDGSVLTAEDVAQSLNAALSSSYYEGRFGYVSAVRVTDDGGVTVQLKTPYENFPVLLDVPIVKAGQTGQELPLGTGPYLYEVYEQRQWLRRRTDWWCTGDLPLSADYIYLRDAQDPAQLRDEFEFNGLGMVVADPGSVSYVDFHGDSELWDMESGMMVYLGCNAKSTVFSKKEVRQALSYAVDRVALAEAFYHSFATPTVLPVSPQSPMYEPGLAAKVTYQPEKLAQAVTEAGLTDAPVVLLVNASDGIRLRVARALAQALSSSGLKVTTAELSDSNYRKALEKGNFDLYLGQTKLSPNMDLSAFFAPKGALSSGGMNDAVLYALCQDALANAGNYYTLYQKILEKGQLCPVLMRGYAVYTQRGAFDGLTPARDWVFHYDLGRTMEQALIKE